MSKLPDPQSVGVTSVEGTADASKTHASNEVVTKELLDALLCPICMRTYQGMIFQCPEGHAICSACKDKLRGDPKTCPSCRAVLGENRNRALEAVMAAIRMPCENAQRGCPVVMGSDELAEHHIKCEYALYKCPHPTQADECKWEGLQSQVVTHIKDAHGNGASFVQTAPEIHPGLQRKGTLRVLPWIFERAWVSVTILPYKGSHLLEYACCTGDNLVKCLQFVGGESPGLYKVSSVTKDGIERAFHGPITSIRRPSKTVPWHIIIPRAEAEARDGEKIPFFVTIEQEQHHR